ncbi:MAG TPA: hypothetical protein HPP66_04130 [Planctomycetes bacterium]|nr:hypothetical protein [Planctomycetota bacterium]
MKVWIYVEGESDKLGLLALWTNWRTQLRNIGHGIKIIPLGSKSQFFRKIGHRAARQLYDNNENIVIGLPDLYPNREYVGTQYEHRDLAQLISVQKHEVSNALQNTFSVRGSQARQLLERFLPSALKHDLEMLLLAGKDELRSYLGTHDRLGNWRNPVEEQDQNHPPKRIVEELFRTKSIKGYAYRDTRDASAVLRNVTDIKTIIYNANNQIECPVFKSLLDWIGEKTKITAYA